ncbi:magnesium transporter [Rufibacter tibetensis]|uniref:Magnesium transporter MgtE n=1 Tax=Rufibacter tibetensis TaxID=512763 RepID=A0A0P0C505_9BACT|nr:magnesium transporter [Rufibacter tibetensis]ALJ00264.1 magnesium transporter [Rufibacter tibetensis]
MQSEITREFIDQIEDAIERRDAEFILSNMEEMYAVDITTVLYELNTEQSKYVMDVLPADVCAEILSDLDSDVRTNFLKNFTIEEIARYIGEMDSDDAVDLLNEQPVQRKEEIIALLEDQEQVADIVELLHYDEDCAGGLMAKELIKVNINWRVGQCIDEIRRQAEEVEKVYAVYVVDDRDKLLGRLSMKTLILCGDETPINKVYDADVISIESYKDEQEVAAVMQKYDLEAIPVVNIQGRLLGRITIDDVIDVIQEQAELSRQLMTGITESIEEDDSVFRLSRARLPWLMVGMVGGLLGARFIGLFEGDIAIIPALAMFTPLITATGGNVGIQSSSIIIQTLANKTIVFDNFASRIIKVLMVAVINGLVMSGLVLGFNVLLGVQLTLSIVVAVALFSVVLLASFMGTVTPMILDKYGVNPAVAAGPFITTANDLLGLAVYFMVAHALLNL